MSSIEDIVNGKGKFIDDIKLPGMVHLAFYRSIYGRARIKNVKADITHKDIRGNVASVGEGAGEEDPGNSSPPVLAKDIVLYIGQPIAAVYAPTKYEAEDRLDTVEVDYEPLKAVMDPEKAVHSEPIIPGSESNVTSDAYLGEDFETEADIVLEDTLYNHRVATNPIETRGIVASYDGDRLTVWTSTQSVFSIKEGLSESLQMEPEKIRVIQTDTGGAFGLKGGLYPEYVVAAELAIKIRKPVKWIESRSEHLMASRPGRGVVGKMKLFASKSGKVLGVKGEVIVDSGAYGGGIGGFSSSFIARQITGPYNMKNAYIHALSVMTDKVPQGPYRGAGRPEAAFFMERMMDLLAEKTGIDPVELRLMNMSDEPLTSPTGLKIEAAKPFFQRAVKELEYEKYRNRKPGIAFFVLVPAVFGGESARVKIDRGKVTVWLGGNSHGQRHELFVRKLVSEELGVDENAVTSEMGDTDMMKTGVGSWGSRSAIVGGNAVIMACRKIKEKIEKEHGKYEPSMLDKVNIEEEFYENLRGSLNSFGSNLATVEIDELGHISVNDCVSCYDVGRALSMDVVISQIEGGSVQGIGQALSESLQYSDDGQMITSSISDAGVLDATRVPNFKVRVVENPSPFPHGAKGLGESPTIGVPAAVVCAVDRLTGIRIRETPIKPDLFMNLRHSDEQPT